MYVYGYTQVRFVFVPILIFNFYSIMDGIGLEFGLKLV